MCFKLTGSDPGPKLDQELKKVEAGSGINQLGSSSQV